MLTLGAAITGTVRDESNNPIEGICVDYFDQRQQGSDIRMVLLYRVATRSDGTYRLGGLSSHKGAFLLFADCAPRKYVREWWDDHPVPNGQDARAPTIDGGTSYMADAVPGLVDGETVTGIDAVLGLR